MMSKRNVNFESKKTHPARGWTSAEICRNRFLGKPAVAPCRMAGSAPHKSGRRRVKFWPNDTDRQLHPHTHHIVAPGFVDRPCRSDCTAGQMDGDAG